MVKKIIKSSFIDVAGIQVEVVRKKLKLEIAPWIAKREPWEP